MERKTMGALIAALRKANGMTQRELAEKLNVSDKTVSRWERNDGVPDLALIPVIAEIFGVTCDELLRGERRAAGEREGTVIGQKGEKQRKRLLSAALSRYRTRSLIAAGLAAAGLVGAMMCNFAFLRAYIAFAVMAVLALAAAVCQGAFVNSALLTVADEELAGEETDRFRRAVVRLAERVLTLDAVLLAFSLPLLEAGDAYFGLTAQAWLLRGLIWAAIVLALCGAACHVLNGVWQKRGLYPLSEKEEPVWRHNRLWQRRCAVGLAVALLLTAAARVAADSIWTEEELSPALEFDTVDSFVEFMEREEYPTLYSDGGSVSAPEPTMQSALQYYDENGNEISEEEALTETLRDGEGNVICTYLRRNRAVAYIRYGTGERMLPIRVVTWDALSVGRSRRSTIGAGFAVLCCAEAAAAVLVYAGKRKNGKIR